MSRQQLPPQIRKVEITDRKTGKPVTRYQVTVDGGRDADGRRQQVRRRYPTERDAREALARIQSDSAAGTFVPRKTVTVKDVAEDWLTSLHNASENTIRNRRYELAPLLERHGDLPVQKLTRADIDTLVADLRAGGTKTAKGRVRRGWLPRSVNKTIDATRQLLDYAAERRDVPGNVAARVKKLSKQRTEMATYTPAEIRTVLAHADGDRNGHLWYLALSGLRRGEIAGLRWQSIDFDAKTLAVVGGRVQAGAGHVVEVDPKTRASRRVLPLDDTLVAVLKRARAAQSAERLRLGAAYRDAGYVAVSEAGEPYTPDTLTRLWRRMTVSAGVRTIRLHDARHTAATAMLLRGVPVPAVAAWLGHADPSITMAVYAHSQDDALKAAGGVLGAVMAGAE